MSGDSLSFSKLFCFLFLIIFEDRCDATITLKLTGPHVTIPQGTLRGRSALTVSAFAYYSFQGIPYAEPPIGNLRFQDPKPAGSWSGVRSATVTGSSCVQYDAIISRVYIGNENCLFLNVYVPSNTLTPLPVMVWIHGGEWAIGSGNSDIYGPDYFVQHNVILVTINYRLGPFGFLSLHTPEAPGNAGLKDQSLALKWVKENINHFGGNSSKITIFGQSAGGASVEYHMLSPMSAGLFHRAIIQSGASTCPWSLQLNPKKAAYGLAEALGLPPNSTSLAAANYLKGIPAQELATASRNLKRSLVGFETFFCPTVEEVLPGKVQFITKAPLDILKSGVFNKVPAIMGLTSMEGVMFKVSSYITDDDKLAIANNDRVPDLKRFVPYNLKQKYGENGTGHIEDRIREHYFPTVDNIAERFYLLVSDYAFNKDVVASLKLHADFSPPTYFYRFPYSGAKNLFRLGTGTQYTGATHTDEMGYMFRIIYIDLVFPTIDDIFLSKRLTTLWTNFAKEGNPTPKSSLLLPVTWPTVQSTAIRSLNIDKNLTVIPNPFQDGYDFWDELSRM